MKNIKRSKIAVIFVVMISVFPALAKMMWKIWYNFLARKDTAGYFEFMNYGYDALEPVSLKDEDEKNRYSIQLYNQLFDGLETSSGDLLEVGCGRGGGLGYLNSYYKFDSLHGVDLSDEAIKKCQEQYADTSIKFIQAPADDLPFSDSSLDFVINVESSHCYPDLRAFVLEVSRVLKPEGVFSICDLRTQANTAEFENILKDSGFVVTRSTNITEQVLSALDKLTADRMDITNNIPGILQAAFKDFAGVKSSAVYQMMKENKLVYMSYQCLLQNKIA